MKKFEISKSYLEKEISDLNKISFSITLNRDLLKKIAVSTKKEYFIKV